MLLQHFYLNNMSQFNILLFLFMRNEHQNYYENNETIWECPYNILTYCMDLRHALHHK